MQRAPRPGETGLSVSSWAQEAFALLTGLPGVRRVGLALAEGGGRRLRFTASDRYSDEGLSWCHVDAYDEVPLNTAVRTGEPVVGALVDLGDRYAGFVGRQRETPTVALAAVPIGTAGQTLGGYVLFFDRLPAFDPGDGLDLGRLAADLGAALRQAQRGEERPAVTLSQEPVPPGAVVAFHDVPPDPAKVSEVRRFLRSTLREWDIDEETAETAALCLSELVTNAVIHAHAGCVVRVLLEEGVLTTTVRDSGTQGTSPAEPLEDPLRVHGRGLQLVEALATRWGSELDSVGTTVWFVLEL